MGVQTDHDSNHSLRELDNNIRLIEHEMRFVTDDVRQRIQPALEEIRANRVYISITLAKMKRSSGLMRRFYELELERTWHDIHKQIASIVSAMSDDSDPCRTG
ncbi:MAG TPA: hypothetical protein VKY59_07200 [Spirillospora sp.]|nr:hypothetical protein [Spirillospora sp.]